MSLEELRKLASDKLGFKVSIQYPNKLCDFKPAYGFIFSELLEKYDFWGYCDIDVIFGNIRGFITSALLENHDVISVRADWLTRCFLLYKNSSKTNTLFFIARIIRRFLAQINTIVLMKQILLISYLQRVNFTMKLNRKYKA